MLLAGGVLLMAGGAPAAARAAARAEADDAADRPAAHRHSAAPRVADDPVAAVVPPSAELEHVVKPGETLGGIAVRAKVPRVLIIEANGLSAPYRVHVGQRLALPRTRHHIVQPGETGFDIAYRYGVPYGSIAVANGIATSDPLHVGQKLLIPSVLPHAAGAGAAAAVAAGRGAAGGRAAAAQTDSDDEGDGIGRATAAARMRHGDAPARARHGDDAATHAGATHDNGLPGDGDSAPAARHGGDTAPGFIWPIAGKVVRGYAARGTPLHHDGLDIVAPEGTAVRATADGEVIFAGREPQSFGNLVVIDHRNGWQSAYGFLARLTVAKGDTVRAHERIGLVGHSGRAKGNELHFEIREANQPIDPAGQLPDTPAGGAGTAGRSHGDSDAVGSVVRRGRNAPPPADTGDDAGATPRRRHAPADPTG